jgi:hypothetical protein
MERMGNVLAHFLGREVDMKKQNSIFGQVQLVRVFIRGFCFLFALKD